MKPRALIIDDDGNIRRLLTALLVEHGYEVQDLDAGTGAVRTATTFDPDVIFLDLVMDGPDGLSVLQSLRDALPHVVVVMMSGQATFADAVRATKLGAVQFLEKPLSPDAVLLAATAATELAGSRRENRLLRQAMGGTQPMLGRSDSMESLRKAISQVAGGTSRVLITGESGTGKELVARAIHDASPRSERAFVGLNCAAIPRELVESELFGHERGAFTGATTRRHGKFEIAHQGTLFLDEVGDLQTAAQAKLLRAIETGTVERVGSERPIETDVRIIAATNRDLDQAVETDAFRADLYYRLNVFPIHVPPLRDRTEDLPDLITHYAQVAARRAGLDELKVSGPARDRLLKHHWPGNVRELINLMERLAIVSPDGVTPEVLAGALETSRPAPSTKPQSLADALADYERTLIQDALSGAGGNVAEAARQLDTDRANLYRRMKRLGVRHQDT